MDVPCKIQRIIHLVCVITALINMSRILGTYQKEPSSFPVFIVVPAGAFIEEMHKSLLRIQYNGRTGRFSL